MIAMLSGGSDSANRARRCAYSRAVMPGVTFSISARVTIDKST